MFKTELKVYVLEDTIFWTEEVENEILRWTDEQKKLADVKTKLEQAFSETSKPSKVAGLRMSQGLIFYDIFLFR